MISLKLSPAILARLAGFGVALVVLTGCDKLKDMMGKNADAGGDAAVAVVDAAAAVAEVPDAAADAAVAPIQTAEDLPGHEGEEARANRDIGFGNYKEELDKLEKEADAPKKK